MITESGFASKEDERKAEFGIPVAAIGIFLGVVTVIALLVF